MFKCLLHSWKSSGKKECLNRRFRQDFGSGGILERAGLVKGPGEEAPPHDAGEFSKVFNEFLNKIAKCISLAYFSKDFKNYGSISRAFGRKNTNENLLSKFNRKIEFLTIFLKNLMLEIEPSEISSFFYNNSFHFGRGNVPYVPPGGAIV